jgi:hypothetical protein
MLDAAYLVASVRTPDGPRHKHICYIGSITRAEDYVYGDIGGNPVAEIIEARSGGERYFWKTALRNLKAASIEGADLEKIVARLEQAVPRPADD